MKYFSHSQNWSDSSIVLLLSLAFVLRLSLASNMSIEATDSVTHYILRTLLAISSIILFLR